MNGLWAALSLLTVLPCRVKRMPSVDVVVEYFPLVGALYGGVVVGWVVIARALGISSSLVVWGMMALPLLMNGFFHFDGWCDTWDGFLPLASQEKRLEIMKDSRVGVFGLGMGALLLLFRWSVYPLVMQKLWGVWWAWVLSRASLVGMAYGAVYPRQEGTGGWIVGRVGRRAWWGVVLQVIVVGGGLSWYLQSLRPMIAVGIATGVLVGMRRLSYRRIGGVTGDVLGATAEMVEVLSVLPWSGT